MPSRNTWHIQPQPHPAGQTSPIPGFHTIGSCGTGLEYVETLRRQRRQSHKLQKRSITPRSLAEPHLQRQLAQPSSDSTTTTGRNTHLTAIPTPAPRVPGATMISPPKRGEGRRGWTPTDSTPIPPRFRPVSLQPPALETRQWEVKERRNEEAVSISRVDSGFASTQVDDASKPPLPARSPIRPQFYAGRGLTASPEEMHRDAHQRRKTMHLSPPPQEDRSRSESQLCPPTIQDTDKTDDVTVESGTARMARVMKSKQVRIVRIPKVPNRRAAD